MGNPDLIKLLRRSIKGNAMSTTTSDEPKLIFPGLAGFYASVSDLWYPMIRIAIGAILFAHGWNKLNAGAADVI
jgi:hypothetical protein